MKIKLKILVITIGAIMPLGAYCMCNVLYIRPNETCYSQGGIWCSDGTCRLCCDENSDEGGTQPCSGTSTNTDENFSNDIGSGYVRYKTYTTTCMCFSL